MHNRLQALDHSLGGILGVATIDLTSGRVYVYNGDAVFPTASTIKVPILIKLFQAERAGDFHFSDTITIAPGESVPGGGDLEGMLKKGPVKWTIRELATAMIEKSDNTATNRCISLAKMSRVGEMLDTLGFTETRLRRVMMDLEAATRGDENVSTPLEMAHIVESIYRNKVVDPVACQEMLGMMKLVKGDLRQSIPWDVEIASKTGELDGVRAEVGVVYLKNRPFVVSIFSTYLDADSNPVGEAARIIYQYFQKLDNANMYGRKVR